MLVGVPLREPSAGVELDSVCGCGVLPRVCPFVLGAASVVVVDDVPFVWKELSVRPPAGAVVVGEGAGFEPPTRLLMSLLRDFNSSPKFFNRVSVASFCPSIALGISSRNPLISSAFRFDSSSRFFSDSLSAERTDSSSESAVSRRSVRLFSAALSSSVSVLS